MENVNHSYEQLVKHLSPLVKRVNRKIAAGIDVIGKGDGDYMNLSFIITNLFYMKNDNKNCTVVPKTTSGKIEFTFQEETIRDMDAIEKKEAREVVLDFTPNEIIQNVLDLAQAGDEKVLEEFLDKNFVNTGEMLDHTEGSRDINKIKNK